MSQESTHDSGSICVLEGLEAVRKRPAICIGGTGVQGSHHLVRIQMADVSRIGRNTQGVWLITLTPDQRFGAWYALRTGLTEQRSVKFHSDL